MSLIMLWIIMNFILIFHITNGSFCYSKPKHVNFSQTTCVDPSLGDGLSGSELARLTDIPLVTCYSLCYQTPDCFLAVDAPIRGQRLCVHISGMDKISLTPTYASESTCTVFVINSYSLTCPEGWIGRFCEHPIPSHSDSGWIVGFDMPHNTEMKVHTYRNSGDEAGVTLIYPYSKFQSTPPVMTVAFPYMSFDFASRTFAVPARREARHMKEDLLQITRVYTNATEASFEETSDSSVLLYTREEVNRSLTIEKDKTENLRQYFLKGYRSEIKDYSVMEWDTSRRLVWYYKLNTVSTSGNNNQRSLMFKVARFNDAGDLTSRKQHWFSKTVLKNTLNSDQSRTTYFDSCWFEGAGNKMDIVRYVKAKVRDEGRPLRVVFDHMLSADVLFLISKDEDVIAVTAPYIESPDKYVVFPEPSIMVYTSVNSDGVQMQQKITFEGSTFHQVVDYGSGHGVRWFLSTRNWRRILRVSPGNQVQYGNESDLRIAANQSCSISACAVGIDGSWCFGSRATAIMPDGEVLIQSPSIPWIVDHGQGRVFNDSPDLQVVMLRSRGGCQKLLYKMGVSGEKLTGCPDLEWLDWFVENY